MFPIPLSLEQALQQRDQGALFVDVRTPAEFEEATIPGAVNIPLFSNEERARIGTVYKKSGAIPARVLGMEIVSPKIPDMVHQAISLPRNEKLPIIVFCWRGGMRSEAVAAFFNLAGLPARQLVGGHKGFRSHVVDFFSSGEWGRLFVLRGFTGVGKTRLLRHLAGEGYPIIDIEDLAGHRGSAFGALGKGSQPSQKAFEASLWNCLKKIPPGAWGLTEGESKNIGRLSLPERFFASLQNGPSLWLNASLDYRVKTILEEYPALGNMKASFVAPIQALKRRLGQKVVDNLLDLLEGEEWERLARELMVGYYDPLYSHTRPADGIEIGIEPEAEGLKRLKAVVAGLVADKS
ncbi:MAG: tRNA 2-selenouridine(34) synthase MnmH [Deltaproteobacteria bacterium]|nr:tRNA 2-selenouridine(34) synthase MnmH [Deltaproteobacteria bacterium]